MLKRLLALALASCFWTLPALAQSPPSGSTGYVPDNTVSGTLGSNGAIVGPILFTGEFGMGLDIPAASTLAATLTPYCSADNVAFTATSFITDGLGDTAATLTTVSGTQYLYGILPLPGCRYAQVKVTAYTSGTATAILTASQQSVVPNTVNVGNTSATIKGASTQPAAADLAVVVGVNPNDPSLVGVTVGGGSTASVATVKAASTAAAATDTGLVVSINPNNGVKLLDAGGTNQAQIVGQNSTAAGNAITVAPGVYRSSSPAFSTTGYAELPTLDATGAGYTNIGTVTTPASVTARNGTLGNGLQVQPFVGRSAISAATNGTAGPGAVDATTGFQLVTMADGTTYTKTQVVANNGTAVGNGLTVFPTVGRTAAQTCTSGDVCALNEDSVAGGIFEVPVATTNAIGLSNAAIAVNTTSSIKASAGNLYGVYCVNANASVCWVQIYNSSSPTCGTSSVMSIPIPSSGVLAYGPGPLPLYSGSTALGVCMGTTATGSTACTTANSCTFFYK